MEITRRDFLKLLGVSTGAAVIGVGSASVIFTIPDDVFERIVTGPRIESWKNSICTLCPGGCGIKVRLIDNIPVRVQGNPLYPINQGAICPNAEAGIEMLFHPDRIRHPLKRIGNRGENQWKPISWDESFDIIAGRMQDLLSKGNPEKLAMVTRDNNEMMANLAKRFMVSYGSPNYYVKNEKLTESIPVWLSHGMMQPPLIDLINTNYALNFGGDFLDEGPTPIRFNQIYSSLRNQKEKNGSKIVHISSYMSRTAAKSTKWIPINPGTMSALALGIAWVMIRDGSYDREFIKNKAFGFTRWKDAEGKYHRGFKDLVSEEYYPEKVSEITGVPAQMIIEIAREFAGAQSSVAISGSQASKESRSFYTQWAIYCLNGLKGSFGKTGGVKFAKEMTENNLLEVQNNSASNENFDQKMIETKTDFNLPFMRKSVNQFYKVLLDDQINTIDTLIFNGVNPLFESARQNELKEALQKIPFVVCFSSFLDETAAYADLILPSNTFLESWEASQNVSSVDFSHFGVQQPVIEPLYETRNFGDLLLVLAQKTGGNHAAAFPWKSYKKYLQDHARSIFNSGEGTIVSEKVDLSLIAFLKKRGWQVFDYSTFDEFWDVLLEKGGWWDPIAQQSNGSQIFKNESGKFEFYSLTLKNELDKHISSHQLTGNQIEDIYKSLKTNERDDQVFLPHYEEPGYIKNDPDFPLNLLTYQLLFNLKECNAYLGLMQELSGLYSREFWSSWVEINPETAAHLGINDGDHIKIISQKGQISAKAKILPTVMPEVIAMPFGRFYKQKDTNPYANLMDDMDNISGTSSPYLTKVRIENNHTTNV